MMDDIISQVISVLFMLAFVLVVVLFALQLIMALECVLASGEYFRMIELGPFRTSWRCS